MKNLAIITVFFLFSFSFVQAQNQKNLSTSDKKDDSTPRKTFISLQLGLGSIQGDAQTSKNSFVYGASIEKFLSDRLSIGINLNLGTLDAPAYSGYTYVSKTSILQGSLFAKYNVLKVGSKLSLAPFLGLGLINYNPQVTSNGKVIRFADGSASSPSSVNDLVIPLGAELGYLINPKVKISLQLQQTYVFSDRLDGTIGSQFTNSGKIIDPGNKTNNDLWFTPSLKIGFALK